MNYNNLTIGQLCCLLLENKAGDKIRENEEGVFNLIKELKDCKGFNQYSKWHNKDVYEHTLEVLNNCPRDLATSFAALFHDIGKIYTLKFDENNEAHFPYHWIISRDIFKDFAYDNQLGTKMTNEVCNLIYYHDLRISDDVMLYNLLERLGKESLIKLLNLKYADILALNSEFYYELDYIEKQKNKILQK